MISGLLSTFQLYLHDPLVLISLKCFNREPFKWKIEDFSTIFCCWRAWKWRTQLRQEQLNVIFRKRFFMVHRLWTLFSFVVFWTRFEPILENFWGNIMFLETNSSRQSKRRSFEMKENRCTAFEPIFTQLRIRFLWFSISFPIINARIYPKKLLTFETQIKKAFFSVSHTHSSLQANSQKICAKKKIILLKSN